MTRDDCAAIRRGVGLGLFLGSAALWATLTREPVRREPVARVDSNADCIYTYSPDKGFICNQRRNQTND